MADLISRQAVIDLWDKYHPYIATKAMSYDIELRALPSIEPELKHAKWIPVKNSRGGHECSLCNYYAPSFKTGDEWLADYCPNCGAKMDEDNNNDKY